MLPTILSGTERAKINARKDSPAESSRERTRSRGRLISQSRPAPHRAHDAAVDETLSTQLHAAHSELVSSSNHQPVRRRVDLQHVPRPGLTQVAETAALADCVESGAAVGSK